MPGQLSLGFQFFQISFLSTISLSRMFQCPGRSSPDFGHPGQRGATVHQYYSSYFLVPHIPSSLAIGRTHVLRT